MGDPKKPKKKFEGPRHPWQRKRIDEEKALKKEYSYKNKREINKMKSILRRFRAQARKLIAIQTEQAKKERNQLMKSLYNLGLLEKEAKLDDVLALTIRDVMERRLQTVLFRRKLANSVKQARQFVTHRHVMVGEKVVTAPSYLVSRDEEYHIKINPKSSVKSLVKAGKVEVPAKGGKDGK